MLVKLTDLPSILPLDVRDHSSSSFKNAIRYIGSASDITGLNPNVGSPDHIDRFWNAFVLQEVQSNRMMMLEKALNKNLQPDIIVVEEFLLVVY